MTDTTITRDKATRVRASDARFLRTLACASPAAT